MLRRVIFQIIILIALTIPSFANFNPLDPTFKSYFFGLGPSDYVQKILVQPDGKIIAGGDFSKYNTIDRKNIVRINADGTIDPSFNPGTGANGVVKDMILLNDGKILVAGNFTSFNGVSSKGVIRLNANGSIDPTFTSPNLTTSIDIRKISLLSTGKIVLAGAFVYGSSQLSLALLNSNGSIDPAFVAGNKFVWVESIAIQSDNKIIVCGQIEIGGVHHTIARVNLNGTIDNSFTGDTGNQIYQDVKIQTDGKIIIAGRFGHYKNVEVNGIARLLSNGNLDATFNSNGAGLKYNNTIYGAIRSLTLQADGKIIATGSMAYYNNTMIHSIVRLNTNGTIDPAFKAPYVSGITTINTSTVQGDGNILIGGSFSAYANNASVNLIARFLNCFAPDAPVNTTTKTIYCRDEIGELSVSGSGTMKWYTTQTGTTPIKEGFVFNAPLVHQDYYVEASNSCAVNPSRTPISVTVNPTPETMALGTSSVCAGESATLRGGSSITSVRATSFSWSDGVVNEVSFVPTQTKTYTVTGTADNGCSSTATITVEVKPLPNVTANASANTVCAGESAILTASGAAAYNWSDGILNGVNFVPTKTKTYTVTGSANNECSSTATITIEVKPLPNVTANASANAVCAGESVILTGSGATPYAYLWSDGINNNSSFTPTQTKTYTVTGFANGCSKTATITIEVKPLPNVTANASANTVCAGESVTLAASGDATVYNWSDGILNGLSFVPAQTKTYTVTGITNGCSKTATASVTVNPLPNITATSSANTVCAGESVNLTASGAASPHAYLWSDGISNNVSFTPAQTKTYTVTGFANGCSKTATITIEVKPLPNTNVEPNGTGIKAVQENAAYTWVNCDNNSIVSGEVNQILSTNSSNEYKVVINLNGCIDSSDCVTRQLSITGVTDNYLHENSLVIFPNPSNGMFAIKAAERGDYTIVNDKGLVITSFTIKESDDYSLHLQNIDNGIYFLIGSQHGNKPKTGQKIVVIK